MLQCIFNLGLSAARFGELCSARNRQPSNNSVLQAHSPASLRAVDRLLHKARRVSLDMLNQQINCTIQY